MAERVELAQVIGQLRQELSATMRDSEGEDLRFELGPLEPGLLTDSHGESGDHGEQLGWGVCRVRVHDRRPHPLMVVEILGLTRS